MKIIGDVGSTHGGTLQGCLQAIDVAKDAGIDIVKFQLFKGNENGNIELPRDYWADIVKYARQKDIDIFASVFDEDAIDLLKSTGITKAKLAYSQNFNLKLIKKLKNEGFEIWASGDATNYPDHADVKLFCVPEYPYKGKTYNFEKDYEWDGISNHKLWPFTIIDFEYLEVHFHTERKVDCPDYWFALSPKELKELVKAVKR